MSDERNHRLIPAVWMIIRNSKDEIFLLRRYNTGWQDGTYTVPAGHVEYKESPVDCAVRELQEEAGVTVKPEDLKFVHVFFHESTDSDTERVSIFFEVIKYSGTPYLAEPEKADDSGWYHKDRLPELCLQLQHVLTQIDQGIAYSDLYR